MARTKFDATDLAVIAKMDSQLEKILAQREREEQALFAKFARSMEQAIKQRQAELARARAAALKEIGQLMRQHSLTVKEIFA